MLDIPITGADSRPSRSRSGTSPRSPGPSVPTEITHNNIQPSIDLTMGVEGRDLGHIADDVAVVLDEFGKKLPDGNWAPTTRLGLERRTTSSRARRSS